MVFWRLGGSANYRTCKIVGAITQPMCGNISQKAEKVKKFETNKTNETNDSTRSSIEFDFHQPWILHREK